MHVRTISCGSGSCVCGIVIREGSVMYEVYRCNPDPRAYDYGLYFPWGQSAELNAQAAVGWSHAMHTSGNEFTVSYSITIVRSDGLNVSALPSRVLEDSLTMCQLDQTTSVEAHAGSIICFLIQSCSFEVSCVALSGEHTTWRSAAYGIQRRKIWLQCLHPRHRC